MRVHLIDLGIERIIYELARFATVLATSMAFGAISRFHDPVMVTA
jgi:hypothetical protein